MTHPDVIYLANFPYGDVAGMKIRPVLSLTGSLGNVPEILVAYISTVIPDQLLESDIIIDPAKTENNITNLKSKSLLRLHKLATIHESAIVRKLGSLSQPASAKVDEILRSLLNL